MSQQASGGSPILLTASGAVSLVPGTLIGVYVNSTTSGTIVVRDGTTSAGTAVTGTITPAVGWQQMNFQLSTGCFVTIGGTLNATFVFQP